MKYEEACNYLESLNGLGSVPGLESISELSRRLGNPEKSMRFVHIAGTNGKGSVGAFVTSVLIAAGYRTGRYLSPAVKESLEIIQCNNLNVLPEDFADIITVIKKICDGMVAGGLPHPTRFEVETAAAFMYFVRQKCDIAVVECGMGGLLDATNIITNTECAVITPIALDHTDFLGDTLDEIAVHKAGIIKNGCEVVYSSVNPLVNAIIEKKALSLGCPLTAVHTDGIKWRIANGGIVMEYGKYSDLTVNLAGIYQVQNAALATECIQALCRRGYTVDDSALYSGLWDVRWFGRFQKIGSSPDFIIDGAHNPAGAMALAESLKAYYPDGGLTFIVGVFADKDYKTILEYVMPMARLVYTVSTPDNSRALSSKTLAEYIKKYYDVMDISVQSCETVGEAVEFAMERTDVSGAVIAFGSLSHLALIEREYRRRIEV